MPPTPAPEPDARPDPQPGPDRVARTASDTSDPLRALAAVSALRRLADQLEHLQVEAALRQGHAWPEIAQALGVTRQAVHKKHARRIAPAVSAPDKPRLPDVEQPEKRKGHYPAGPSA